MQVYQTDASISNKGIINLISMPYLYNKKVKLVIIPTDDNSIESEQRKLALERLLKIQETLPASHWTDEDIDNFKYERLKAKHL